MRLSLTQENLSKALATVGRVVSSRSSLPVLSNILLQTDGSRLRLSATNLEIGINYWIGSKVDNEGALTVPARLFTDFVTSLPHGNIELEAEEAVLTVKTPHYESKINGIAAEEFPLIPRIESEPILSLPVAAFREAIQQVVVAASLDEARPVLAGVYIYVEDDHLIMVATDSYRLAEKKLKLGEKAGEFQVIIPARTMQELARMLTDAESEVRIYRDDNQVMFQVDQIELVSRIIEGQFPNYRQIIPQSVDTSIVLDTAEFSRITKVASLFARENTGSVRIEVNGEGQVSVASNDAEVGGNTSTAEGEVTGEDGEIALNARYLSDALVAVHSPGVMFSISGKLNPCVLVPAGPDAADDYLHIVMPLRT